MTKINTPKDLEVLRSRLVDERKSFDATVVLCGGTGCRASRCQDVIDAIKHELLNQGLEKSVRLRTTGCHGFCEQGPLMLIEPGNILYCHVSPDDANEIITKTS